MAIMAIGFTLLAIALRPAASCAQPADFSAVEDAATDAIASGDIPGVVVLVGRGDEILYHHAWGSRAIVPHPLPMLPDTIFDIASLTKPFGTTLAVMSLVERGAIKLDAPLGRYLREFRGASFSQVTIRRILTHSAGLPAIPAASLTGGFPRAARALAAKPLDYPPGTGFQYSDTGFILLAEVVRRVSGDPLDRYLQRVVFTPLHLGDTSFHPSAAVLARVAPTEFGEGTLLHGRVHDPRARQLGGVAGHAGMFSTASALARLCRMLLDHGRLGGVRVLRPETVRMMWMRTPDGDGIRALGWDVSSGFSRTMAPFFPPASVGHTGFTGTAVWLDPPTRSYMIILTNRVHPSGGGSARIRELRTRVAAAVGAALFGGVRLQAIFAPEHGVTGAANTDVPHGHDAATGRPIWSLYGPTRRPTAEMLRGVSLLVFDIQDVGVRYYTYLTTLMYVMEEAGRLGVPVVVLDRPNPITGRIVEGPVMDADLRSFTGPYTIPVRTGLTMGEFARMVAEERKLPVSLTVVAMTGWDRSRWYDDTGLPWVNPSPNIRSVTQALLYSGVGLLEATNVSVGRGTDMPFEVVGAPWMDGDRVAAALSRHALARAEVLADVHRDQWRPEGIQNLLVNRSTMWALLRREPLPRLVAWAETDRRSFLKRRAAYLIYR